MSERNQERASIQRNGKHEEKILRKTVIPKTVQAKAKGVSQEKGKYSCSKAALNPVTLNCSNWGVKTEFLNYCNRD